MKNIRLHGTKPKQVNHIQCLITLTPPLRIAREHEQITALWEEGQR